MDLEELMEVEPDTTIYSTIEYYGLNSEELAVVDVTKCMFY